MTGKNSDCACRHLHRAAAIALVMGMATGLSGCIGGSSGLRIEPTGVGWGHKLGKGDSFELVDAGNIFIKTDKSNRITEVKIGSEVIKCASPLSSEECRTAKGGVLDFPLMKRDGYKYLHILNWEQGDDPDAPGDMRLIGGKTVDRTGNMPTRGTASYQGDAGGVVLSASGSGDVNFEGKVSLQADFGKGTVSGRLHDFRQDDDTGNGRKLNGVLDLQNGKIQGNTMSANLSGSIEGLAIDSRKTRMIGGFFGPKAEEVGGGIVGRTTTGGKIGALWRARKQ